MIFDNNFCMQSTIYRMYTDIRRIYKYSIKFNRNLIEKINI